MYRQMSAIDFLSLPRADALARFYRFNGLKFGPMSYVATGEPPPMFVNGRRLAMR